MIIKNLFNIKDVLSMEQSVLNALEIEEIDKSYFKEPVGQYLYNAWLNDKSDTRILEYSFPLVQSLMVKHIVSLRKLHLEADEIFNILCIGIMEGLLRYKQENGKIFTWIGLMVNYRILDLKRNKPSIDCLSLIEDIDILTNDFGIYEYEDFKSFLYKLKDVEGPTANRILDAFILVLLSPTINASLSQDFVIQQICKISRLDVLIVKPYYNRILDRYVHSIAD